MATAVGFTCGAVVNYFLNRAFVFATDEGHGPAMVKFFLTALMGLGINMGLMYLGTAVLHWYVWAVQVLATGFVFCLSFLINKIWTFKDQ